MKYFFSLVALASLAALPLAAQERAAGQANDAQVNWSALSAKLDAIDSQNKAIAASVITLQTSVDGINTKLGSIAACGAQKKVWDGTGCATAASSCVPTYTTLSGSSCPAGATKIVSQVTYDNGGQRQGGGSTGGNYSAPSMKATYSCLKVVCS